jgi:hypothetical protein
MDIERLRFSLSRTGLSNTEIQYICDSATGAINQVLLDIVSGAVSEAIDYALGIGADEFIDDVQVLPDSSGLYQISTHSGNLDYSKDAKEMLPLLLKNAKISQDGHRYKTIPIQKKENQVEHSMFSVLQSRQDVLDEARTALSERIASRKQQLGDALKINLSKQVSAAHTVRDAAKVKTGEVEFKTASDRQDPSTAWVIPEKNADMSDYISQLNQKILDQGRESVRNLVDYYQSQYAGV